MWLNLIKSLATYIFFHVTKGSVCDFACVIAFILLVYDLQILFYYLLIFPNIVFMLILFENYFLNNTTRSMETQNISI